MGQLRLGMRCAVEIRVNGGVLDSEIRAQINHAQTGPQERSCKLVRQTVRKGEKGHGGAAFDDLGDLRGNESQTGMGHPRKLWKNAAKRLARQLPGSHCHQFHFGMGDEQAHQFLAGVPTGTNDRNFNRGGHRGFLSDAHRTQKEKHLREIRRKPPRSPLQASA